DVAMPLDIEPVEQGLRDDPSDALHGRELFDAGLADRGKGPEVVGDGPRGDWSDVADVERNDLAPQLFRLRLVEFLEQLHGLSGRVHGLEVLADAGLAAFRGRRVLPARGVDPFDALERRTTHDLARLI